MRCFNDSIRFVLLLLFLCVGGCEPGKWSGSSLRIYALDGGRIEIDLSRFAQNGEYGDRKQLVVAGAFLIRHPEGDLLWDTGLEDTLIDSEGEVAKNHPTWSKSVSVRSQLEQIGLRPDDIEYLSLSHSHWDHLGNANMFSGSTFLVDKDERAHMFSDRARANAGAFRCYNELETAKTIEFDGDYDVFGDGLVKILAMPGHTPGHTVLLINLPKEGPVLLSGDLYHLLEARTLRTVPKFNTDVEMTLESMDRFETIATELGARVIVQHSLSGFERLPRLPGYLGDPKRKQESLRDQYEEQVRALVGKAELLRKQGLSSEAVARAMHAERRALGIDYKNRTDPKSRQMIYDRNLKTYGDKLGPSIEFLRGKGNSWEDIIESAARPGSRTL